MTTQNNNKTSTTYVPQDNIIPAIIALLNSPLGSGIRRTSQSAQIVTGLSGVVIPPITASYEQRKEGEDSWGKAHQAYLDACQEHGIVPYAQQKFGISKEGVLSVNQSPIEIPNFYTHSNLDTLTASLAAQNNLVGSRIINLNAVTQDEDFFATVLGANGYTVLTVNAQLRLTKDQTQTDANIIYERGKPVKIISRDEVSRNSLEAVLETYLLNE